MARLILLFIAIFTLPLHAEMEFSDEPDEFETQQLYVRIVESPKTLYKGEIFSITLRNIVTTQGYEEIFYTFSNMYGLKRLHTKPKRRLDGTTYYDQFYFRVTSTKARLPDITPAIKFSNFYTLKGQTLTGQKLSITALNPPKDYCGVMADHFEVIHYKTTAFDRHHNILVFMADANRSNVRGFHLPQAGTQSFESQSNGINGSSFTYYAVLPSNLEHVKFRYFNLQSHRYESIDIPIEVEDDSVSTQTDLTPTEHGHVFLKTLVFAGLAAFAFILFLTRKRAFYAIVSLGSAGYAVWLSAPLQHVCLRQDAPILLLPMKNATVFEIAPKRYDLIVEGRREGYVKVRLHNQKIGWIRDEDICPD